MSTVVYVHLGERTRRVIFDNEGGNESLLSAIKKAFGAVVPAVNERSMVLKVSQYIASWSYCS